MWAQLLLTPASSSVCDAAVGPSHGIGTAAAHHLDFPCVLPQVTLEAVDEANPHTAAAHNISFPCVLLQVTLETVDEAILGMTQRKLKLDAAVMDGLTVSSSAGSKGKGGTAETAAMGQLLQAMLAGDDKDAEEEA